MRKIFLLFTFYFLLFTSPAWAQTTPTPTPTSSVDRIQEIKERVEERIQEIKEKAQNRAFWGTLKQITNSTLILETPKGERRVKITPETKISLDKKEAKQADLGIGNFIIAVGSWDEKTNTLSAKRLLAFSKPPKQATKRQAISGKVSDISPEEKILVIQNPKKPQVTFEVKVADNTVITKKVDNKIKKVNFEAIAIGDRTLAVATKDKEGNGFTAKIIHVIPGKAAGLEKQTTPTPTPKVKTSPTPTPKKPTPTPSE